MYIYICIYIYTYICIFVYIYELLNKKEQLKYSIALWIPSGTEARHRGRFAARTNPAGGCELGWWSMAIGDGTEPRNMWLTCDIVDETYVIVDIVDDIDYGIMVDIVDEYWWMMVGWWFISCGLY